MSEEWVMVGVHQFAMMNVVANHMRREKDAHLVLAVWNMAIGYIKNNTGEIMASSEQLADDVNFTPDEVDQALKFLEQIGAFVRAKSGRYAINHYFGISDPPHEN
jgi:uncharacterized protein YoxC